MSTDLLSLLGQSSQFPATSRYYKIEIAERTGPDDKLQAYLRRRIVPPPENFATVQEHQVREGERPDDVAAKYLGDPEQFWRLCDANCVLNPPDLTATAGDAVRITLPEGIPTTTSNA